MCHALEKLQLCASLLMSIDGTDRQVFVVSILQMGRLRPSEVRFLAELTGSEGTAVVRRVGSLSDSSRKPARL